MAEERGVADCHSVGRAWKCAVGQEMHSEPPPCTHSTENPKSGAVLKVQCYPSHSQVSELGREQNEIVLGLKILMSKTFHFLFLSKERGTRF